MLTRICLTIALIFIASAILIGRNAGPEPVSTDAKIRWLEAKVLEIQERLDRMEQINID